MNQQNLNQDIQDALEKTLAIAKKHNVSDCEVLYSGGTRLGLKAESGNISEHKVSQSQVFGVRLFKNNKVGLAHSEDSQESSLEMMVKKAITNLEYSQERPYETLHSREKLFFTPEIHDSTPLEKKIEFALQLESKVQEMGDDVKGAPYNGLSEGIMERANMNSLGGLCYEKRPSAQCYTSALLEKDAKQAMYAKAFIGKTFQELDLKACVETSVSTARDLLKGKSIKSGNYRVAFSPDIIADLFGVFSSMFSAKSLVEGTHPLKDKLNKSIASPLLNIVDSPRDDYALYPELFDDEGFATQENPLIVKGVLNSLYHNSATSKEMGVDNTFNASRSARGVLGVGPTLIKVLAGQNKESAFKERPLFEVIDMQGLHSGADAHSGNFSFAASGYLWDKNERVQIVRGVTVSGNFYEAIKHIEGLGDTLHSDTEKSFVAPMICFESLSVAGD